MSQTRFKRAVIALALVALLVGIFPCQASAAIYRSTPAQPLVYTTYNRILDDDVFYAADRVDDYYYEYNDYNYDYDYYNYYYRSSGRNSGNTYDDYYDYIYEYDYDDYYDSGLTASELRENARDDFDDTNLKLCAKNNKGKCTRTVDQADNTVVVAKIVLKNRYGTKRTYWQITDPYGSYFVRNSDRVTVRSMKNFLRK